MAAYKDNALDGLRAAVAAAWPEVVANGIYYDLELTNATLETIVRENRLPFAAISVNFVEGDWTAANQEEVGTADVYYVARDSVAHQTIWSKLETLRDQVYDTAPTGCLVIGNPVTNYNLFTPLMDYFAGTGRPFRAGQVRIMFHIGESA